MHSELPKNTSPFGSGLTKNTLPPQLTHPPTQKLVLHVENCVVDWTGMRRLPLYPLRIPYRWSSGSRQITVILACSVFIGRAFKTLSISTYEISHYHRKVCIRSLCSHEICNGVNIRSKKKNIRSKYDRDLSKKRSSFPKQWIVWYLGVV